MEMCRCLRPVDLARAAQVSVQTVRDYERLGFLPPADRTLAGHRCYAAQHSRALEVARTVIQGYGWQWALEVMQAVHRGDADAALAIMDASHADLDHRRRQLKEVLAALQVITIASDPPLGPGPARALRIGEAARQVGVRPSALRFWEQQGLLQPIRDPRSGFRVYDDQQLRRLRVVVLLRRAGYGFEAIRTVLDEVRAGRPDRALAAVEQQRHDLMRESRACAEATTVLWTYLKDGTVLPGGDDG
jgi:DNA-binding transcriptional MerR regulator